MSLSIGIASGHGESLALVVKEGRFVAMCAGESLNHHNFEYDQVVTRIKKLILLIAEKLQLDSTRDLREQTDRIVLSLPGVSTAVDKELGLFFLRAMGWKNESILIIVDDTWSGLIGGLLHDRGICAFAGSGASVFF